MPIETPHFRAGSKNDNWGDWHQIQQSLIDELEQLRKYLGYPVYVTSGYREGDGSSEHHRGNAADIVCPEYVKIHGLFGLYLAAERFNFKGIGVYPDWKWRAQRRGGLHLDMRDSTPGARWMGVRLNPESPLDRANKYIPLDLDNLKQYRVI